VNWFVAFNMGLFDSDFLCGLGLNGRIHPSELGRFFPSQCIQDQSPGAPWAPPHIILVGEFIVIQSSMKFVDGNFNIL
jgi:hypothetical protein